MNNLLKICLAFTLSSTITCTRQADRPMWPPSPASIGVEPNDDAPVRPAAPTDNFAQDRTLSIEHNASMAFLKFFIPGFFRIDSTILCVQTKTPQKYGPDDWNQIDDMPNPGRGWTTFNSFNSGYSNRYYPNSTIAYFRLTWRQLEAKEGEIAFDLIDQAIEQCMMQDQKLALRIMPESYGFSGTGIPEWLINAGVQGVWYRDRNDSLIFMPDFDDPLYLNHVERVIKALGGRYDGEPHLDHIDIGFVGHWGEWHICHADDHGATMPTFENAKKYIDWHLQAFAHTPVMALIGSPGEKPRAILEYAVQHGTGWRLDCWGDYREGWNHMQDHYPIRLEQANTGETWKQAPVALETCGTPSDWFLAFPENIDAILDFAVEYHASVINAKSDSLPDEWYKKFQEFTKKIGYRFRLDSISFPELVIPGQTAFLESEWSNLGNAPVYYPYALTAKLTGDTTLFFSTPADITSWLPGRNLKASIKISPPPAAPEGRYELELGFVDARTDSAVLLFLTDYPEKSRWYKIGTTELLSTTIIQDKKTDLKQHFYLHQNVPNPFNPTTEIRFETEKPGFAVLKVYDTNGKNTVTLLNNQISAGVYEIKWNSKRVPSGVYFYKLMIHNQVQIKKCLKLK